MKLLGRLSEAAGPPGEETAVRRIVRDELDGVGELRCDGLGSLLCEKRGAADEPRVMLDSHLDEVGFMIQSISSEGRLPFVPLGGWWAHVLLGQRVEVLAEGRTVPGVIGSKPPHFLGAEERKRVLPIESLYIDVGASKREEVEALGIRVGDTAIPWAPFREMAIDGVWSGKALDNRIGVALMCETMRGLVDRDHPNTVIGVGAVQEEVGVRGATTASELARPDVAIVLECTPADDLPGHDELQGALGRGPQIRHFDPTAIANRRLVRFVENVARDKNIDLQMAVRRGGGTDAKAIHCHGSGVPAVVIGVPARYIHSHVALMRQGDYELARDLVAELVQRLDRDTVAGFRKFD